MTVESNTTIRTEFYVHIIVATNPATVAYGSAGRTIDTESHATLQGAEAHALLYSCHGHATTVMQRTITETPASAVAR